MSEARFKIGDRVESVKYEHIAGTVVDAFQSVNSGWRYEVEAKSGAMYFFPEDEIELKHPKVEYSMQIQIDIASNVVIASLYEVDGPNMRPIAKGNGHIIHEGELGIAQSASYACKRLYQSLGGTITKGGSWR